MDNNSNNPISESDFMRLQIAEMQKYKWIRSEEAHKDLGTQAIIEWISLYAKDFRKNNRPGSQCDLPH